MGLVAACAAILIVPSLVSAQGRSRESGFEAGLDVIYQLSTSARFDGGSRLEMDDDFGIAASFGYRFNPKIEVQFLLDWAQTDYNGTLQSALVPSLRADVHGDMDSFAARINGVYNFIDGPLTPFVSGGLGYSWFDTNIPAGQVQIGCWWDPWWGEICTPYQPTRTVEAFTYQVGAGARWDLTDALTMRFMYEHSWFDFSKATSAPEWDQFKVGAVWRF
jgi:opacity protein-like surface antigen